LPRANAPKVGSQETTTSAAKAPLALQPVAVATEAAAGILATVRPLLALSAQTAIGTAAETSLIKPAPLPVRLKRSRFTATKSTRAQPVSGTVNAVELAAAPTNWS